MAKFISIRTEKDEFLLNLETIKTIHSYKPAYDDEDAKEGVQITFISETKPIIYSGINFEGLKSQILDK